MYRFLFENTDAELIDGIGLQPDPELAARNLERAREAIRRMGPKWCLRQPADERREPANDAMMRYAAYLRSSEWETRQPRRAVHDLLSTMLGTESAQTIAMLEQAAWLTRRDRYSQGEAVLEAALIQLTAASTGA